ncbi:MAG: glycoside hydrolase family 3 C-terminal domain-containing protein [Salinivirgaceae bacterium]|jgi:beta-glucosidase|nr:glycoside hydrolase family 3 C-terminal domain-containing protein [Salinivirgaceae bacterium]
MKTKNISVIIAIVALFLFESCNNAQVQKDNTDQETYDKVDALLAQMTLQEKVGQMLNVGMSSLLKGPFYSTRDSLVFDSAKVQEILVKYGAGSVQNLSTFPPSTKQWRYYISKIQKIVKTETRLGIPVLYGIDAAHGANYTAGSVLFPHEINVAASFNTALAKQMAEVTSYELKASAIPWNFAPDLDVARHTMWGRIYESFGEDTYVVEQMGVAMLEGAQGDNPAAYNKTVSCAKHFLGYGASYNGKDRAPVVMSENYLRQVLLPPFKTAIENGLLNIMISSGAMNGVPSHIDHKLITKLLKEELNFKGFVISDWNDIDNLVSVHKVAANEREAVKMSVLAGLDMCMEPYDASFAKHLISLVEDDEVPMSRIDDAVRRILYVKHKAGIFDDTMFEEHEYTEFASAKSDSLNLAIAEETLTLLKNKDDILPLNKNSKVLITGVASNSLNYLNGGWSRTWSGQETKFNDLDKLTILQAVQEKIGASHVTFAQGSGYVDGNFIAEAVKKARNVDVIVACIGEKPSTEKPSDIDELDLPDIQLEMVKQLAATGKPVVLVMVQGRPRIIRRIEPLADGILMAFLPGNEGGKAIANTLYGDVSPSGKLPYTYPQHSGGIWTYDHQLSDERDVNFGLKGFTPQYEFGYGLSYTTFEYSDITISSDSVSMSDKLTIEFEITNTGEVKGKEAALLFVSDEVATISPAVKQLKRFTKVELEPNESKKVNFELSVKDLMFVDRNNKWIAEPGYFTLKVADKNVRFYLYN